MDHMHISGTEPSSVILSQTMQFKKLKSDGLKVPKQAEAKRDGVINPQYYNFKQFLHGKFRCSHTLRINRSRRRTWLHVPSGTLWSTSSDTHQVVEIYKETSIKLYTPFLIGFN